MKQSAGDPEIEFLYANAVLNLQIPWIMVEVNSVVD